VDQDAQRALHHVELVVMFVLSIGIGILATATEASRWSHASLKDRILFDPTSLSLTGLLFGSCASAAGRHRHELRVRHGTSEPHCRRPQAADDPAAKAAVFTALAW